MVFCCYFERCFTASLRIVSYCYFEFFLFVFRNIRERIDCRIEHQLRPCNDEYADVMGEVLYGLLIKDCAAGGFTAKVKLTMTTFHDYMRR